MRLSSLLSGSSTITTTQQQAGSAAVVDSTPPLLALVLGAGGEPYTTGAVTGVITRVPAGSVFVDPGASAVDTVDGDVTERISRSGLMPDTSRPTDPSQPYLLAYDVSDSTGNKATTQFRRILVVCPTGERVCLGTETADGLLACSTSSICGVSSDSSSSLATSSSSSETGASAPVSIAAAVRVVNTAPVMALLGDGEVTLVAGSGTYSKCAAGASQLETQCDPGVTATDAEDGLLTPQVSKESGGALPATWIPSYLQGELVTPVVTLS